jgi:hypothetical protein
LWWEQLHRWCPLLLLLLLLQGRRLPLRWLRREWWRPLLLRLLLPQL